ncbi:MAG: HAD family hydrolase [Dehalococcoidia bacterium]
MSPARFDVVVFDLGGVLVQIAESWAHAHELAGLPPYDIAHDAEFERRRADLAAGYQLGRIDTSEYYSRVAEVSRGAYAPAAVQRLHHAWSRHEYEGVGDVIDALERSRVATGALSNTNPAHWARLDGTPEYPTVARLQHRHASHVLGLEKPDPRAYERFCEETGFEPARVLFFDDVLANVEAARESGWTAFAIDRHAPTAPQLLRILAREGVVTTR